jgi:hypothetical protein
MIPILSLVEGIWRERILNHRETWTNATPGFAIEIKDETDSGIAMLIAEIGVGCEQPKESVGSINNGRDVDRPEGTYR